MNAYVLDIEAVAAVPDEYRDTLAKYAERQETTVDEYAATCPALARPVAVGIKSLATGVSQIHIDADLVPELGTLSPDGQDVVAWAGELDLLAGVAAVLAKVKTLVTFAGRVYDLPLLRLRARAAGAPCAPIVATGLRQKPWESLPHIDLMEDLSFGRATRKYPLAAYCAAFGVPNPKEHGSGADVAELVANGETAKLVAYLQSDLDSTAMLYERVSGKGVARDGS